MHSIMFSMTFCSFWGIDVDDDARFQNVISVLIEIEMLLLDESDVLSLPLRLYPPARLGHGRALGVSPLVSLPLSP